jgi:acetyl esterase/lipase
MTDVEGIMRDRTRLVIACASFGILSLASSFSRAQSATPPECENVYGIDICPNLAYGPFSNALTGNTQRLDIYKPAGDGPFPTLVWIHGGGWTTGDRRQGFGINNDWPGLFRQLFRGYAVVVIDYRWASATEHVDTVLGDVKRAIRWIKWQAPRYHLNATRIALWGHSAGANLAALAAATAPSKTLEPSSFGPGFEALAHFTSETQLVLGYAGIYDFRQELNWAPDSPPPFDFTRGVTDGASYFLGCDLPTATDLPLPDCTDARRFDASPEKYLAGPPVYLAHGDNDPFAHPFQPFAYKIARDGAGQPTGLRWVPGGGHGGDPALWRDALADEVDFVLDVFLKGI